MVQRKKKAVNKKGELLQMAWQQVRVHKQQFNKPPIMAVENLRMENNTQFQIKKYLIHKEDIFPQDSQVSSVSSSFCCVDSVPDKFENMKINNLNLDQPEQGNTFLHESQVCDTSDLSSFGGMDSESDRLEEMEINYDYDPPPEQIENLKEVMRCTKLWFSKHRLCVDKSSRLNWALDFEDVSLPKWNNIVLTGTVVFELKKNQVVKFHSRTDLPTFSKNSRMFWGFISANFRGILPLEDDKLNVTKLRKMITESVLPLVDKDSNCSLIHFPEYHSSFFDSACLKNILHQRSFERYMWPSFMEDLNPMEHLWEMMESKLCEHICDDLLDLVSIIDNLWNYDLEFRTLLNCFVEVMPFVMRKIVETKGGTI